MGCVSDDGDLHHCLRQFFMFLQSAADSPSVRSNIFLIVEAKLRIYLTCRDKIRDGDICDGCAAAEHESRTEAGVGCDVSILSRRLL